MDVSIGQMMIKFKASRARHLSINNNNIIGEPTNGKDMVTVTVIHFAFHQLL